MSRTTYIQTNFTAGELSPRMYGRVDFAKYRNGVKTLTNFTVFPHGGAQRRPGTRFVAEVKDSSKRTRLVRFEFSVIQSYVLEFGEYYIRFYMDQGQIYSGTSPYEISTPWNETEVQELMFAQSADVLYIVHADYAPRKLSRTGHTSWTLSEVDFIDGPYLDVDDPDATLTPSATSGSITMTASNTPFTSDMVGALLRWQADDSNWYWLEITGYTDASHVTCTVRGNAGLDDGGPLPNVNPSGPFRIGAWGEHEGYPAAIAFYEQRLWFGYTDNQPDTVWGSVSADYENFMPGTADTDAITATLGSQGVNAITSICPGRQLSIFTQDAEWAAGSPYEAMTPTTPNYKAHTTFGSEAVQALLVDDAVLYVQRHGKRLREFTYSFEPDKYTSNDLSILASHLLEQGGRIQEMAYQSYPDNQLWVVAQNGDLLTCTYYRAEDVVAWSRHETDGDFESVCVIPSTVDDRDEVWVIVNRTINGATKRYVEFIEKPYDETPNCFYVDSGLTYENSATISGATQANPVVITATAHGFSNGDNVYIRNVEGMTEINNRSFTVANATANTFELQGEDGTGYSAYTGGGTAYKTATTITGLDHLEGKEIDLLVNGSPHARRTVSSGEVTLDTDAWIVQAGLPYSSQIETLPYETGGDDGTAQGKIQRINQVVLRYQDSLGGKVGFQADSQDPLIFRLADVDLMDLPPSLGTGDKDIIIGGRYERSAGIWVVQDQPLPLIVTSIIAKVTTEDM